MEEDIQENIIFNKVLKKRVFIFLKILKRIMIGIIILFSILYIISQTSWGLRAEAIREVKRVFDIDLKGVDFEYENSLNILGTGGSLKVKLTANIDEADKYVGNYSDRSDRWNEILTESDKQYLAGCFKLDMEEIKGKYITSGYYVLFVQDLGNEMVTIHMAYYE